MATYGADEMIGKTLIAKENLIAYYGFPNSKSIFKIFKGQNAGLVFSWINKNTIPKGSLYWEFRDENDKPYFIVHDSKKIGLSLIDTASVKSDQQKASDILEQQKKETEGIIPYYIKKIGTPVLITAAGLGALYIFLNVRNKH